MKKTKTPPTEVMDIEFVEPGNTLRVWGKRSESWRLGKVHSIGTKFFHIIIAHKLRKVLRVSDEINPIFLMVEGKSHRLEGGYQ